MGNHSRCLVAAAALVAASGGAFAQQQSPGQGAPSSGAPTTAADRQQHADPSESALKLFARLSGQWEGQIEMRREDGMTSSSVISANNRVRDGGVLESCLSGFVFGGELEAASLMRVEQGVVSSSWLDSTLKSRLAVSGGKAESNTVKMSGELADPRGKSAAHLEQSIDCSRDDQYVMEVFRVSAAGKRERLLRLDMSRARQPAMSVASFDSSRLLKQLRDDRSRSARANADD